MNTARLLLAAAALLGLAACQNKIKQVGDDTGAYGDSVPIDRDLPSSLSGANPENADFSILSDYKVLFDFDSYAIRSSERSKLEAVANWMNNNSGKNVAIAGHTDARGTTDYNVALGERRALAVRDYLLGLGVGSSRIITVSYGEERPANPGDNESAWAANRRAETGVLP
jgi:peptidoglycan-associated lipoprotein